VSRIEDLREVRAGLIERLEHCASDQNYAVLARTLADVLAQIDALDPEPVVRKESPLDEFSRKLIARRRADSQALGKSTSG
jgi:hypothetical protein